MSTSNSTRITVAPRKPRAPIGRLASLKPQGSTSINRPQSIGRHHAPRPTTHPKTTSCPNPGCPAPHIVEEEGQKLCTGCGTVIAESNIVSEVTFGESSSGAAVVQGTFVGEGQSHTRSFGPGFQRGGGMESRELTEANGNTCISQLARPLNIPESASKAAGQVFKLAVGLNFIQGRRTKNVAAVCLYIACRRQAGNTVMLIDFADILMINVFKLGRTYKALLDELRLGGNVFLISPIDPESLIYRFAKQLEFGPATMRVSAEAVRIIQRMNRDWMTIGRRPAGLCGAALILAARMNNFRRTVREVVYVVKVTEITISQRLNEFGSTESGDLTVDQFRSVQLENSHDPPAFTRAKQGHKFSRSAKRAAETAADIEEDLMSEADSVQPRRVDADGFAIPNIPIDPALMQTHRRTSVSKAVNDILEDTKQEMAKARDGKGKDARRPSILANPTPQQIASEDALEAEMQKMLQKGSNLVDSVPAEPKKVISDSVDIDATEFDDDPEIANCLLTPAEVDIKERIWVTENKEYLRLQQEKAMKRAFEEAMGGGTTRKPRKRRKARMGDVTYLEGQDGEGRGSRASTPAEATRRMLEVRGYSKKINYSLLDTLYGGQEEGDDAEAKLESFSRSRSRSRSRSMSVASRQSLPPAATPRRRRKGAAVRTSHTATTPVPESPSRSASRAAPVSAPVSAPKSTPVSVPQPTPPATQPTPVPAPVSAPASVPETAPQPTPPPTAPGVTNTDKNAKEGEPASEQPDPDDVDEDYGDYDVDDHLDEAFAGTYEDDYYDVGSESD